MRKHLSFYPCFFLWENEDILAALKGGVSVRVGEYEVSFSKVGRSSSSCPICNSMKINRRLEQF